MSLVGQLAADYSAGVPSAEALKNAGFVAVVRYFSPPRASWMLGKPMKKAELQDMRRNNIAVAANWQRTKDDWTRGAQGGTEDSGMFEALLEQAEAPENSKVYVSVDANPTEWQLSHQIIPYLTAWQERISGERMGVYCNKQNIDRFLREGIGSYFWQHGWDGRPVGVPLTPHPRANILQFEIDKFKVENIGVDKNRILTEDFGQFIWDDETEPPVEDVYEVEDGTDIGVGYYDGHNKRKRIYIHSTENQDWITSARAVANYQKGAQNGSYHDLIDDNVILNTLSIDKTAWAVLKDNSNSINIALVLTSGAIESWSGPNPNQENRPKSREQWLKHEKMLDMLAWRLAYYSTEEDIPLERVDIAGVSNDEHGVSSHNNYTYGSRGLWGFKDGSHWDIPDTFPYDVVLDKARAYVEGASGSSVQELFAQALTDNPWVGEEADGPDIRPCPDKQGRYKHYKKGSFYYHPRTGIHAVPDILRQKWSKVGWEAGFLGYPVSAEVATNKGIIQEFQHGTISHINETPEAFTTHGMIHKTWDDLGALDSKYGFPQSEELDEDNRRIIYQKFTGGRIFWITREGPVAVLKTDL